MLAQGFISEQDGKDLQWRADNPTLAFMKEKVLPAVIVGGVLYLILRGVIK